MNEVTTLYGFLAVLVTTIGVPLTTHFLQKKSTKKVTGSHDKMHDRLELSIKRLELLNAFRHDSENARLINRLYEEYKEIGGNSYIDDMYEDWKTGKLQDDISRLNNRLVNVEKLIEKIDGKAA